MLKPRHYKIVYEVIAYLALDGLLYLTDSVA